MATARLVASEYSFSSTALTMSNEDNMYTNTDSTTYATIGTTSSSTRYIYLRGFNFGSLPTGAEVSSFTIKYKGNESSLTTSTTYRPRICNNTTTLTGASSVITTSVNTYSFTGLDKDWDDIVGYGSDFGVRFTVRSSSNNTQGYLYLYGVEIEVTYTIPTYYTVTPTLTGSGTIDPSSASSVREDTDYTLTITPTTAGDTVTIKKNDIDDSSNLVGHYDGGTLDTVLGTYALTSGGFNGSGATYFSGLVGKGHTNTQTTSNYYSSGNGTIAVFTYQTPITVPSNATIKSCYVMVNGHAESTSQSAEYMCVQLYAGTTAISDELNFKSIGTSNSTQTIYATTLPTASQCANLHIQCRLGYYGGAINGATVYVEYEVSGSSYSYYTYTTTITGTTAIAVTIGSASDTVWYKADATYTTLGTSSTSDPDEGIQVISLLKGTIESGDTVRVYARLTGYLQNTYDSASHTFDETFIDDRTTRTFTYTAANGGTFTVTYTPYNDSYTYTTVISARYARGNYSCSVTGTLIVYKVGSGGWTAATKAYKKVNGSWVEQTDLTTIFNSGTNYVYGGNV